MRAAEQPGPASLPKRRAPSPTLGRIAAAFSVLGFGGLCFIAGAAVMHAGGPVAKPLADGFKGAGSFFGGTDGDDPVPEGTRPPRLSAPHPDKAADGYTLWTTTQGAEARLYDKAGEVAHRWSMPAEAAFPAKKGRDDGHWERCVLMPNGDLFALC
ncbi:MAG: hypothetical protein K2W96_22755, partial [Gemmataceae bacterium]|nr:hypothetical protein [Gemmataceae bacterium]